MATSNPEALKQVSNAPAAARGGDEAYQSLRHTGGRAWQLHASLRAADHFIAQDAAADRDTGSWLVAGAVDLAEEVAGELDGLARTLKDRPSDPSLSNPLPTPLQKLRSRSHKLHAAARAADHYFDQDTSEDRVTASWLVANALGLAARLASEIDDEASQLKRASAAADAPATFSDAVTGRKMPGNLRGAVSG